ncbi:hypothetical protein F2Q70_00016357 [Brassica cretica]|uniref:Uncharacterized protein n=1 Tax=Brassica cretica TaxID=69181 RepID=A0A8S9L0K5_BRACR|nr:hypothetical protein F2Q70_00016357 [Brassica cretica]KAF2599682.1 hypothetical protein F2Q68_00009325 [Brassica cretica]
MVPSSTHLKVDLLILDIFGFDIHVFHIWSRLGKTYGKSSGSLLGRLLGSLLGRLLGSLLGRLLGSLLGRLLGSLLGRLLGSLLAHYTLEDF